MKESAFGEKDKSMKKTKVLAVFAALAASACAARNMNMTLWRGETATQVGSGQDWPNERILEVYVLEAKEPKYPPAPSAVTERVPSASGYSHLYTIDIQPNMCISTNCVRESNAYAYGVDPAAYAAAHEDVRRIYEAGRKGLSIGDLLEQRQ